MSKILEFQKRNKKRNARLYAPGTVEGIDYIVCPVSMERLSLIKTNYIIGVLKMTVEDYDALYPGVRTKTSETRIANIKAGLKIIDPKTGKTRYQISQELAHQTLSKIGSDGLSGYKRKGQNTRNTHLSTIDENGRNGFQRLVYNRKNTFLEDGLSVEQHSHIKRNSKRALGVYKRNKAASKASKKAFEPLINLLERNNIKYYFDNNEYGVRDPESNNYYFFDLVIPDYKIAVEYQGKAWHSNPFWPDDKWDSWNRVRGDRINSRESLKYDYTKARTLYLARGYTTYHVWEDSYEDDIELIFNYINILMEMKIKNGR